MMKSQRLVFALVPVAAAMNSNASIFVENKLQCCDKTCHHSDSTNDGNELAPMLTDIATMSGTPTDTQRHGPISYMVTLFIWCIVIAGLADLGMARETESKSSDTTDYLEQYLKILPDESHREACRDLAEMVSSFAGDSYRGNYLCIRETFTSNCMPFMHTHLEGSSNKKMMLQTQRGHNDYDKEEDLLKTYLKEKDEGMKGEFHGDQHVAFNSKAVQDYLKPCKERLAKQHEEALERVVNMPILEGSNLDVVDRWRLYPSQAEALQRYLNGTGMIVYLHVTYTAGTTILGMAKTNGMRLPSGVGSIWCPGSAPFPEMQELYLNSGLQMASCESQKGFPPAGPLRFDEMMADGKLLFVTTWRNPVKKLHYRSQWGAVWWGTKQSNNYYLRKMIGKMSGTLTRQDVELGKQRMRQHTVILILEWLPQSVKLLCTVLQWDDCELQPQHKKKQSAHSNTTREGFGTDEAYTWTRERERLDMELYEYAVELNLKQLRAYGLQLPALSKYTV